MFATRMVAALTVAALLVLGLAGCPSAGGGDEAELPDLSAARVELETVDDTIRYLQEALDPTRPPAVEAIQPDADPRARLNRIYYLLTAERRDALPYAHLARRWTLDDLAGAFRDALSGATVVSQETSPDGRVPSARVTLRTAAGVEVVLEFRQQYDPSRWPQEPFDYAIWRLHDGPMFDDHLSAP